MRVTGAFVQQISMEPIAKMYISANFMKSAKMVRHARYLTEWRHERWYWNLDQKASFRQTFQTGTRAYVRQASLVSDLCCEVIRYVVMLLHASVFAARCIDYIFS